MIIPIANPETKPTVFETMRFVCNAKQLASNAEPISSGKDCYFLEDYLNLS
jgi:hypothetical protein